MEKSEFHRIREIKNGTLEDTLKDQSLKLIGIGVVDNKDLFHFLRKYDFEFEEIGFVENAHEESRRTGTEVPYWKERGCYESLLDRAKVLRKKDGFLPDYFQIIGDGIDEKYFVRNSPSYYDDVKAFPIAFYESVK